MQQEIEAQEQQNENIEKFIQEADDLIGRYIHSYNYEHIWEKTEVALLTLRHPS